ncbi:MAG TPA: hypothetical protein VEB22_07430 [Phycisphaerales bacterium]|nr:hypothetical protein [Phycisphaerales bacterium]
MPRKQKTARNAGKSRSEDVAEELAPEQADAQKVWLHERGTDHLLRDIERTPDPSARREPKRRYERDAAP